MRKIFLVGLMMGMNVACSNVGNNIVKNAQIDTYANSGEQFAELSVDVNLFGMTLPAVSFPIKNPTNSSLTLGQVSLNNSTFPGATSDVGLMINLSQLAGLPAGMSVPYLPNGMPIPVSGVDPSRLITFNVGSTGRMYLDLNTPAGTAIWGIALPIQQFDSIGSTLSGINVFPKFQLDNGISGVAGVFTGSGAGQNGLALFVDASALLHKNTMSFSPMSMLAKPTFVSYSNATAAQERQLLNMLYKLSARRTKLNLAK